MAAIALSLFVGIPGMSRARNWELSVQHSALRIDRSARDAVDLKFSELFERNGAALRNYCYDFCNATIQQIVRCMKRFCSEALSSDCTLLVLR